VIYFHTKHPNLCKYIFEGFGMESVGMLYWHLISCGHLVYFVVFFPGFGILYQQKSGNPEI
jgi:hypothetical protein